MAPSLRPAPSISGPADSTAPGGAVDPAIALMAPGIPADWTTMRAAYYVATVVGAGAVLYSHWGLPDLDWLFGRKRPQMREWVPLRRGTHTMRYFATALAGVAFANAMVSLAASHRKVPFPVALAPDQVLLFPVDSPSEAINDTLVLLLGCALAIDIYFSWLCYNLGQRLFTAGGAAPPSRRRWEDVLVHVYIWGLYIFPFVSIGILNQRQMRDAAAQITVREKLHTSPDAKDAEAMYVGFIFSVACVVLRLIVGFGLMGRFATGLRFLALYDDILELDTVTKLHALSLRSVIYSFISILLYVYAHLICVVGPYNLQLPLTTTPFHLGLLLASHACFKMRFPSLRWGCGMVEDEDAETTHGTEGEAQQPGAAGQQQHQEMQKREEPQLQVIGAEEEEEEDDDGGSG